MIRFIHTSDVHFGMENYGRIDSITGLHSRLLDFEHAFNMCIDTAIERNVDFFLFCGDAYKTATPSPTHQRLLARAFMRLYKAEIPLVAIVGNHDHPLSFGKATTLDIFAHFPIDKVHIIQKPSIVRLVTQGGDINIVGVPWPTRNTVMLKDEHILNNSSTITRYIEQRLTELIQQLADSIERDIPAVLAGHLTVSSGIFSGSEKRAIYGTDPVLHPSQLAIAPFDYIALGHLHRHQQLNPIITPPIVYSGSIERIDFGERKEPKGFCVVTIEEKNNCSYEFIETPTRPFVQIEVMLNNTKDQTQQLIEAIKQKNIEQAIVKIIYTIPSGKTDAVDLYKIQRACTEAQQLASLVPIREHQQRPRRSVAHVTMKLEELFALYCAQKDELKPYAMELQKKLLELQQELDAEEMAGTDN